MSSSLKTRLKEDLIQARKGREKLRTLVLSTTLSELRNREIELGKDGDDAEVLSVIGKAVKRRKEAAGQMRAGGREELATKEDAEDRMHELNPVGELPLIVMAISSKKVAFTI